eukprot:4618208-Prymnesium_polylepis.1
MNTSRASDYPARHEESRSKDSAISAERDSPLVGAYRTAFALTADVTWDLPSTTTCHAHVHVHAQYASQPQHVAQPHRKCVAHVPAACNVSSSQQHTIERSDKLASMRRADGARLPGYPGSGVLSSTDENRDRERRAPSRANTVLPSIPPRRTAGMQCAESAGDDWRTWRTWRAVNAPHIAWPDSDTVHNPPGGIQHIDGTPLSVKRDCCASAVIELLRLDEPKNSDRLVQQGGRLVAVDRGSGGLPLRDERSAPSTTVSFRGSQVVRWHFAVLPSPTVVHPAPDGHED